MDCTTLTIGLDNPANGVDITLHFKTSKGEKRTTLISKGQKKTEKFSATPGFTITVSADGIDNGGSSETIAYKKPAGCSGNGSGGGLPVTGAAAGTIAGGAALLLIVGGVLFVMARRRKVKFTA
jgi:LPXTG-motif cell wall-anchored protein